jgi:hypothetical protein
MSTLNLSYRRAITPALNLVFNVTDVFRSQKVETVTDTASLKEHTLRTSAGRIAYIGLSWRFGGVQGGGQRREGRGQGGEGWRGGPPPDGAGGPGGPGGGPGM